MVQAAVVQKWGEPPIYSTIDLPEPTEDQVRIQVLAAGLHNLVRSRAAGKHFSVLETSPPHIPGTDGVGALIPSGDLVYFNCLDAPTGSFADEINVNKHDVFKLPEGTDRDKIAILANPVMSSWMALFARAGLVLGQEQEFSVAIVGATGVSGQAAVQIARAMGAEKVIAIGKPGSKLERTKKLGATAVIPLSHVLEDTDFMEAANADIVLDYLWGDVMQVALTEIVAKRKNKTQRLTWVQIGALAGNDVSVSAASLRKANVVLLGCGPGSWTHSELYAQIPAMLETIVKNKMTTEFAVKNLPDVGSWWTERDGPRSLVKPSRSSQAM